MTTNLKPVDELLSVRQRIKELQAREKELAEGIKSGELDSKGDFAIATISERNTTRFDKKAAEAELGDLSRFNVIGSSTVLRIEEMERG
jgi:hypothetical protein